MIELYYTVDQLGLLLELEYKYGTPSRFRPAFQDVLNYLESVSDCFACTQGLKSFFFFFFLCFVLLRFAIPRNRQTVQCVMLSLLC